MNRKIPEYLVMKATNTKLLVFVTLFSLVFINVYTPFEYSTWFHTSSSTLQFVYSTITIIGAVIILMLSRILLYYVNKRNAITHLQYYFWLIGEIILIAIAYTAFNAFILHDPRDFYAIFQRAIIFIPLILFIPYIVSYLYFALKEKDSKIHDMLNKEKESTSTSDKEPDGIIHFKDEKDMLKLSVKQNYVFYLEAADNYVDIYYLNKNTISKCMLRNSLKSLEDQLAEYNFIRCHRSFIVNLNKVKVIHKEKDGLFLNLDQEGIEDIPISKTYAEDIMRLFSQL